MIRAVIDTNVLVSGVLGVEHSSKPPAEIFRRLEARVFGLVTSDHILEELARTLRNPYFLKRISAEEANKALAMIQRHAEFPEQITPTRAIATHPEDDFILAAAMAVRVDYLVTGDRQLLALHEIDGIDIVSPAEFVTILDSGSQQSPE